MLQPAHGAYLTPALALCSPYYLSSAAPSDEDEDDDEADSDDNERGLLGNADGSTLLDEASEIEPPVR